MTITVSQLNVFPVKGLKGIALDSALATERGLAHDRRFMVVDPRGEFLTQREVPRMATVWTEISGGELRLAAPDHDEIALPLEPTEGAPLTVEVWNSTCKAIAPSQEADEWLTTYLRRACRLVYMPDSTQRPSNPRYGGAGPIVGFADGYAFLVVSEASLEDLNGRLAYAVTMDRFRANIVVKGASAFGEDHWKEFGAGEAILRMAKPCGRCEVTTTDQSTGEVIGPEPLATLAGYRMSQEFGVKFGMNAVTVRAGWIRVGDTVDRI